MSDQRPMNGAELEQALQHDQARRIQPVRLRNDPTAADPERLAFAEGLAAKFQDAAYKMGIAAKPWDKTHPNDRNLAVAVAADVLASLPPDEDKPNTPAELTPAEVHARSVTTLRALVLNGATAAHNLAVRAGRPFADDETDASQQARVYLADAAKTLTETIAQAADVLAQLEVFQPASEPGMTQEAAAALAAGRAQ